MNTVLFDTNVFDRLASDAELQAEVRTAVERRLLKVIVTRTIADELGKSPFNGVPDFFPYEYVGNTVGRVGLLCAGDSIGGGEVFDNHLGNSRKENDALVVDAASWHADWLVSEDARLLKRADEIRMRSKAMSYSEFRNSLLRLVANGDA